MIRTIDGWITPYELEQGCQIRAQHDIAITGGWHNAVLGRITDEVIYGTYTGQGFITFGAHQHDVRFFEDRMWMYDGHEWFVLDGWKLSVVPCVIDNETAQRYSDILLDEFSDILT